MAVEERDPHTGYMTTGHEWNGIKELNTPVPRPVYGFLIADHLVFGCLLAADAGLAHWERPTPKGCSALISAIKSCATWPQPPRNAPRGRARSSVRRSTPRSLTPP